MNHFCNFYLNDSFTVFTIIVRKQFKLQHQSSQKYGIFQSHPVSVHNIVYEAILIDILYQETKVSMLYVAYEVVMWRYIYGHVTYTGMLHIRARGYNMRFRRSIPCFPYIKSNWNKFKINHDLPICNWLFVVMHRYGNLPIFR